MNLLRNPARPRQQGLVLFISLIVLVIMTLAAIAMVRSITASTQVANNLALRQGTTAAADVALESARQWLIEMSDSDTEAPKLNSESSENADNGYSPTNIVSPISPGDATQWRANTNWVWVANSCSSKPCTPGPVAQATAAATVANANGFSAAYFIQRGCSRTGPPSESIDTVAANGNPCNWVKPCQKCSSSTEPAKRYVNYLITVRIQGPKNTVSFYQASLY